MTEWQQSDHSHTAETPGIYLETLGTYRETSL